MIKKFLKYILNLIWKKFEPGIVAMIDAKFNIVDERLSKETNALNARMDERIKEEIERLGRRIPQVFVHPRPEFLLEMVSYIAPKTVPGKSFVRIGNLGDGGYVMLDEGIDNSIVYNFGVGNDVSWDIDLVERGCNIYQYDHTIDAPPMTHPNLHFSKVGIAKNSSPDGTLRSILDLLKINGHDKNKDLIMNMDIEGCEWDILYDLDESVLDKFSQIIIEFHHLFDIVLLERMQDMLFVLKKISKSHQAIHVHANNFGRVGIVDGIMLPETLEITYVRRSDHLFEECNENFPLPLDKPNDFRAPDYFLGMIGKLWSS